MSCIRKKNNPGKCKHLFHFNSWKKRYPDKFWFSGPHFIFHPWKAKFLRNCFHTFTKEGNQFSWKMYLPFQNVFFSSYFHKWKKKSQILFYFLIKFHVKKNILQNSFFFFFFLFVLTQKIKFEPENHIFQLFYFPGVNPGKKRFSGQNFIFHQWKATFPQNSFFFHLLGKNVVLLPKPFFLLCFTQKKNKRKFRLEKETIPSKIWISCQNLFSLRRNFVGIFFFHLFSHMR